MFFDSIIFDLDGTLWKACSSTAYGWNRALEKMGRSERCTPADIEKVAGKFYMDCVKEVFPNIDIPYPELAAALSVHEKNAVIERGGTLYPGLEEGLTSLKKSYKLYLVSNCAGWYLNSFFDFSGLSRFFEDSTCHGMTNLSKDLNILNIMEKNGLSKSIYIGDTMGDFVSAKKAGTSFGLASYGFGKVDEAKIIFEDFHQLTDYFQKLRVLEDKAEYRKNVAAIIIDKQKKILMGKKKVEAGETPFWQLPQGGIEEGESAEEAITREITEETGMSSFSIIGETDESYRYIWNEKFNPDSPYIGQEQIYFLIEAEDIAQLTETDDFDAYEWVDPSEAVDRTLDIKKPVYTKALKFFHLLED
ncbi:MAG: NUDIX domain-containing protein [Bacteriovoracaceae bacterium]|jgi:phosphoglycolate phosphatase|nr:NUDIX domain-containing protein [Bacteriovoracaceae bacterium]